MKQTVRRLLAATLALSLGTEPALAASSRGPADKPGGVPPLPAVAVPATPRLPELPALPGLPEAGVPAAPELAPALPGAPAARPAQASERAAASSLSGKSEGPLPSPSREGDPERAEAAVASGRKPAVPALDGLWDRRVESSPEALGAMASALMDGAPRRGLAAPAVPAGDSSPRGVLRFLGRATGLDRARTFFQYGISLQRQADVLADRHLLPAHKLAAIRELERMARVETIEILGVAEQLDPDPQVRAEAGRALEVIAAKWAPTLMRVAGLHPLAGRRADAARELGFLARHGDGAVPLIEALADRAAVDFNREVRLTAIEALAGIRHPKALFALTALRERAADDDPGLRSALALARARSAELMGRTGPDFYEPPADDLGDGRQPLFLAALKRVIAVSAFFTAVEFVGGMLTGSLALKADAMHLLADLAINVGAAFSIWLSRRPPNSRKSYGYLKMEPLMGLLSAFLIAGMAGYTLFEAYHRLGHPAEVSGGATILLALAGLASNALSTLFLYRYREDNLSMKGAFLHAATDAVGSAGIIIGGILILAFGWLVVDPVITGLIVLLVAHTTWDLAKRSWNVLIDSVPPGVSLDEIEADLLELEGAASLRDLHVWSLNSSERALTAVLFVKPGTDIDASVVAATRMLRERHRIRHATVQVQTLR